MVRDFVALAIVLMIIARASRVQADEPLEPSAQG